MKITKYISGVMIVFMALPFLAAGQTNQELELRKALTQRQIEQQKLDYQTTREARARADVATKHVFEMELRTHFWERFYSATERLLSLQTAMEARIVRATESGFETREARAKLSESRVFLGEAREQVSRLRAVLSETYTDRNRALEARREATDLVNRIQTNLRNSHSTLMEAVRILNASMSN